ncbi:hypothetical protein CI109_102037 [Kwoniella shandongensis]|uniref:MARVEL domain-containing protein n=1 Tax=Kwoniella shandongensis TaxID=1734106 RepID=A0AAJ8LFN3_9TREE
MLNPLQVRSIGAAWLIVLGVIALGISAHVEHIARRTGYNPSTFPFNLFVGVWTVIIELVLAACRQFLSRVIVVTYAAEIVALLVSAVLWLEAAQKVLAGVCPALQAEFGLVWVAFTSTVILLGYLLLEAFRLRARGVSRVWSKPLFQSANQSTKVVSGEV